MSARVEERPRVLHWFRADLRLQDNTAFSAAASRASQLANVFVFDERLLASTRQGAPRIRFLRDCVERLRAELEARGQTLIVRRGSPVEVVADLARQTRSEVVTWNRDPSSYARSRDEIVFQRLAASGVRGFSFKDRVVFDAADVDPCQDRPIAVFSPYRKAWWRRFEQHGLGEARRFRLPPACEGVVPGPMPSEAELGLEADRVDIPAGGERAGYARLRAFLETAGGRYKDERDHPALDATSRLSPYLRFGAVSIRDCFRAGRAAIEAEPSLRRGIEKWIDELIWREFFQAVLDADPSLTTRNHRPEFDDFDWEDDPSGFEAWCEGRTGYPFVDAGMRELRATGHMHNRTRMVVASFLTKDLLIDWRRGEAFFMRWLVDGDPASNSGGWQWAASSGTDASEHVRIFNPVLQGERFDPEGDYIRRWVPELEGLRGGAIHRPWEMPLVSAGYPRPIVDHFDRRRITLERFARVAAAGSGANPGAA